MSVLQIQESAKDNAKLRETEEKIRRAKEAQEKREREKKEKMLRKKALVDINAGTQQYKVQTSIIGLLLLFPGDTDVWYMYLQMTTRRVWWTT